ncbi:MAG: hypothetical protein DCC67_00155 [Planctomycetota bacterium]|nr:MAG: hypothetical protein DCC67_00155 [Planctomycetota bacterium]
MTRLVKLAGVLAIMLAISADGTAAIKDFDGGAADGNLFLTPANWNDAIGADDDTVPGPADRAIINAGYTVQYLTADVTTLGSLIIGADWPTTGDVGTTGRLDMNDGKIIVTGGGDNFQLGRACCNGDGILVMFDDAELEIGGSDPVVGTRDNGVLDIGGTAAVYSTQGVDSYWRLGNYGPSFDQTPANPGGLQGNGLLSVHDNGSFRAHVIFIADNDATGEIRVADNGSVTLTGNLMPRPSGFQAGGAARVHMIGSNATLSAFNLESESLPGEVPTSYTFEADVSGVSPIVLQDAINITGNALTVSLTAFALPPLTKLTLFDGDQALAGNRIFGTFSSVTVNGVLNPANYTVIYDQAIGDIQLMRIPEPATALLLGLALAAACGVQQARRRSPQSA